MYPLKFLWRNKKNTDSLVEKESCHVSSYDFFSAILTPLGNASCARRSVVIDKICQKSETVLFLCLNSRILH